MIVDLITLTVNDREHAIQLRDARLTLLDVLRFELGLTGAKEGCGIGVCGACTVIVDGEMISSCLQLVALIDGASVRTVEGLAKGTVLDPVQQAFIDHNGLQCGACTPGQIMAARSLLDQNPRPTEEDVVAWMSGNLCRCTGYAQILRAVLAASQSNHSDAEVCS